MRFLPLVLTIAGAAVITPTAHAHFKLLSPASWLVEDDLGDPQKTGPCGPGPSDSPMMTDKVTTVTAGDTIMVEFDETIHHPGWFRISLVENRDDLKDPDFPNADCTVDMSKVPTTAHDNALVDGLAMDTNLFGQTRSFKQMVKIPDKPCEKCTLQVIQVMADTAHRPPGCVYHHCADLHIVAAGSSTSAAGTSAPAAGGGGQTSTGTGGNSAQTPAAGSGGATTTAGTRAAQGGAGASATATASSGVTGTTSTATGGTQATAGATAVPAEKPPTAAGGAPSGQPASNATTAANTTAAAPAAMTPPKSSSCSIVMGPGVQTESAVPMAALLGMGLLLLRRRRTHA